MKVLLVTPKNPPTYIDALYLALRTRVGTCDFFPLDDRQSNNLEEFFRRHIRLAHFDRILLMFDSQLIYSQSPFLRHLPTLAILSLDISNDDVMQQRRTLANFKTMPWMRWIGCNVDACHQYQELGYDAYWIPPVYDSTLFGPSGRSRDGRYCHVYATPEVQQLLKLVLPAALPTEYNLPDEDFNMIGKVKPEDIFIYWPAEENNFMPMVKALACGAAVITVDPGLEKRVLYGWRSDHDLIFLQDMREIPLNIKRILQDNVFRRDLSNHAIQRSKLFTPATVGRRIGVHIEIPVRNPNNYVMKQRIFGFEI